MPGFYTVASQIPDVWKRKSQDPLIYQILLFDFSQNLLEIQFPCLATYPAPDFLRVLGMNFFLFSFLGYLNFMEKLDSIIECTNPKMRVLKTSSIALIFLSKRNDMPF